MDQLVTHLIDRVLKKLPGEEAHIEMAPLKRPAVSEAKTWSETRLSAVLVLLYPDNGVIHTALMMRPDYGGVHSKQVSFPGGRKEAYDPTMIHTALREAREELNIDEQRVQILGRLSELYIPPSKSLVTPVLGYISERPDFIPQPEEVDHIIEADLLELLHDDNLRTTEIVRSTYLMKGVPAFIYKGYTIWGATAMILNEVKWLVQDRPVK